MAYITYSEYRQIKGVEPLASETFEELSLYAKDIVDGFTFSVIENRNLAEDAHYRSRIVRAMALIIDSLSRNVDAIRDVDAGRDISSKSETVGSYSYSVSYKDSRTGTVGGIVIPPLAKILLMPLQALGRTR